MYYQQGYRPPSQQNKPGRKKGMGKGVKALIASLVSVVVVAGIIVGVIAGRNAMEANRERQALAAEVEAVQNVYLPNIYVDGIAIGGKLSGKAFVSKGGMVGGENAMVVCTDYLSEHLG